MPANIPDLGAVHHLGGQFTHNVFASAQKDLLGRSRHIQVHAARAAQARTQAREQVARGAAQTVSAGRNAFARNMQTQQRQAQQAQRTQAANVRSGRAAPAPGSAPRTFAMGTTPAQRQAASAAAANQRTMQSQRNFAHGEALKFQQAQFKTQQQGRNYAHGQAIQEEKRRAKEAGNTAPESPATPNETAASFSHTPEVHTPIPARGIAQSTFSSQLAPQSASPGRTGTAQATFSHEEQRSTPPPIPPFTGNLGAQFSHGS